MGSTPGIVARLYHHLHATVGPLGWWPADRQGENSGRDEIIIGAVLVQNTAWGNVERALAQLRAGGMLALRRLALADCAAIEPLIRTAGTYRVKAVRLQAVARFFAPQGEERWTALEALDDATLRAELLAVHGVGRETADAIMLYALGRRTFVVDAYALRIGARHGLFSADTRYEAARDFFMRHSPADAAVYNEFHALLVWAGSRFCKPQAPRCAACPLAGREHFASAGAWRAAQQFIQSNPSRPGKLPRPPYQEGAAS